MIRTDRRLRICTALLIANLCFIWGNSLLPGNLSGAFSEWVKNLLAAILPVGSAAPGGSGLLRKIAHFTEFMALGMLLTWRFGMLEKGRIRPFVWGVCAACVDETIQRFVPDRGPSLKDVGIDTCGVAVGMVLLLTGHHMLKKYGGNKP